MIDLDLKALATKWVTDDREGAVTTASILHGYIMDRDPSCRRDCALCDEHVDAEPVSVIYGEEECELSHYEASGMYVTESDGGEYAEPCHPACFEALQAALIRDQLEVARRAVQGLPSDDGPIGTARRAMLGTIDSLIDSRGES